MIDSLSCYSSAAIANLPVGRQPHIAVFKYAQGWKRGPAMEVFMEAYEGSLLNLLHIHRKTMG
jgi:hypothetical protein